MRRKAVWAGATVLVLALLAMPILLAFLRPNLWQPPGGRFLWNDGFANFYVVEGWPMEKTLSGLSRWSRWRAHSGPPKGLPFESQEPGIPHVFLLFDGPVALVHLSGASRAAHDGHLLIIPPGACLVEVRRKPLTLDSAWAQVEAAFSGP